MRKMKLLVLFCSLFAITMQTTAQKPLTIENVRKAYLRTSGEIMQDNIIKGYFFFYQTDKIDRKTFAYTLGIYDENLNKIKEIEFEDDRYVQILESSYNGNSIMFLFYNIKEKTLEYRAYGFDGKQKSSFTRELTGRSNMLIYDSKLTDKGEIAQNEKLFDLPDLGYTTVYPLKEKKFYTYEINTFLTNAKKQWTYAAAEEQEDKFNTAVYLGNTDSILVYEVMKKKSLIGSKQKSWLLGLNMYNGKKMFEISMEEGSTKLVAMNLAKTNKPGVIAVVGPYFNEGDDVMKDRSQGISVWEIDSKGKILSRNNSSWTGDFAKLLPVNSRGKIQSVGNVYIHKFIQTADGKYWAIGEGYNKVVSAVGVASAVLSGSNRNVSLLKIKVTDMVIAEFSSDYKLVNAGIYEKFSNSIELDGGMEFVSPHLMAKIIRANGGFDYDFAKQSPDKSSFYVGYSDWERSGEYKGRTFNSISYDGTKLNQDKIKILSKATYAVIRPAKPGFITIIEYFRKEKKIEVRLEKMN